MATDIPSTRRQIRRARRNERSLYLAVEPYTYVLSRIVRNRPLVRLPRLGIVVNDAALIREAYLRHDDFIKTGDESAAWAITQVFGPYAMLNVEGEDHREVREHLRGIFGPRPARERAHKISAPIIAELRTRLEAGEQVDVVEIAKLAAGCLMAELGGHQLKPDTKMLLLLRNGLRDRKVLSHPETFDITREVPRELRLLWFGAGPHFCIGFTLSVELLKMLAQVLLDLDREVRVVSRKPSTAMVPAYASLMIEMVP